MTGSPEVGAVVVHRRYVPYSHAHYAGNLVDGAYSLAAAEVIGHVGARPMVPLAGLAASVLG